MSQATTPPHQALVDWEILALRVRLALFPSDPRTVTQYLCAGKALVEHQHLETWHAHDRMLNVLLDSACDTGLPASWRHHCLAACWGLVATLSALAKDDYTAARLKVLAQRLAMPFAGDQQSPEVRS